MKLTCNLILNIDTPDYDSCAMLAGYLKQSGFNAVVYSPFNNCFKVRLSSVYDSTVNQGANVFEELQKGLDLAQEWASVYLVKSEVS